MDTIVLLNKKSKYKSALFYFKLIKKYFYVFIASFIISFFTSFMICRFSMPTKYYSTGFFGLNQVVNATVPNATIEILCSNSTCGNVYEKMLQDGVKHADGSVITLNELHDGISGIHNYKSLIITVKFVNQDSSIVSKVVNYFLDDVMEHISDETKYGSFRFVFIGEYANSFFQESDKKPIIVFLSVVGGLSLSIIGVLLYDTYYGKISDSESLTKYGDVFKVSSTSKPNYEIAVCSDPNDLEAATPLSTIKQLEIASNFSETWIIVNKGTRISTFKKTVSLIPLEKQCKICLITLPKK